MKVLKKIAIGLGILLAIPLIAALFISKEYKVKREMIIDRPKQEVFDYIKMLKNQVNYTVWAKMDPEMNISFRGDNDGTPGFVYRWESKSMGTGEQEIKKITDGERIDIELRFLKPFASTSPCYLTTEAVSDTQTKVTWAMDGKMAYPTNFMRLFMDMETMIGDDYVKSLTTLKGILEKQ